MDITATLAPKSNQMNADDLIVGPRTIIVTNVDVSMETDDVAKMVLQAAQLSPQACVEQIVLRPRLGDL